MEKIVLVGPVSKEKGGTYSNGVTTVIDNLTASGFEYVGQVITNRKSILYFLRFIKGNIFSLISKMKEISKVEIMHIGLLRLIKYIVISDYISKEFPNCKIHVHDYFLVKYLNNKSVIVTLHGFFNFSGSESNISRETLHFLYLEISNKSELVHFLTDRDMNRFTKMYPGNYEIKILPNGISKKDIRPKRKIIYDTIKFIMIGRLDSRKGQLRLLKNQIISPKDELIIVGTGPDYDSIKRYVRENNLTNVMITGYLKHDEVISILDRSHILLLNSKSEGLPMVILEALTKNCRIMLNEEMKYIAEQPYFSKVNELFFSFEMYQNKRDSLIHSTFKFNDHILELSWSQIQRNLYTH